LRSKKTDQSDRENLRSAQRQTVAEFARPKPEKAPRLISGFPANFSYYCPIIGINYRRRLVQVKLQNAVGAIQRAIQGLVDDLIAATQIRRSRTRALFDDFAF
jgi:hypothetical protein